MRHPMLVLFALFVPACRPPPIPEEPTQPPHRDPIVLAAAEDPVRGCIRVAPRAGHEALAALGSTCPVDAVCAIATDDHDELRVTVPAGGYVEVVSTRPVAPAVASITCHVAGAR